ncbi:MAG: polymerase tau subunit [Deltaproteobacteria bacterium]|nr:polymerase tau subunit [Deltaproteobacteria bacterium]
MSYLVLARKWRPQKFSELIGQEHVSQTLKNAIDSGRVAHAFLFTGARGVGKTTSARILAKTLNCEKGPTTEPCNECSICKEITAGLSVDVLEIDGASNNGVDEIRELRENVKYLPAQSRYKIFIIDEVHMLSNSAFNALLKTLEEPPPHIKFIFATTEPHKVPITILSRCQRFDFKRIPLVTIFKRLRFILDQEAVVMSDDALAMVARKGDGSMRDALSALDQVLAFCGDRVADADVLSILGVVDRGLVIAALNFIFERDSAALIGVVKRVDDSGCNIRHFCHELIEMMRTLLLLKSSAAVADLLDLSDRELAEASAIAEKTDMETIQRCIFILLRADTEMAHSSFTRLLLEMALIRMASLAAVIPVQELLERLKKIEAAVPPAYLAAESRSPSYKAAAAPDRGAVTVPKSSPPPKAEPAGSAGIATAETSGVQDWQGFVLYVKSKKPMLASKLEKGSPLKDSAGVLHIGYQKGSLEFSMLQEPDYQQQLGELAAAYYGRPVSIKILVNSRESGAVPLSIAEKKTVELARQEQKIKDAADKHPLVMAALDIFGGEIVAYKH